MYPALTSGCLSCDKECMNDLIQEAEEDLRRERIHTLWARYGKIVIAAIAALIIGTGAFSFYDSWQDNRNRAATEKLVEAFENAGEGAQGLEILRKELPKKQAGIVTLIAAGRALNEGDSQIARGLYKEAIENRALDPYLRDMARISLAGVMMTGDDVDLIEIEKTLKPILKSEKNIWYAQGQLYWAVAQADHKGEYASAVEALEKAIADKETAAPIRQLSSELKAYYAFKAKGQVE